MKSPAPPATWVMPNRNTVGLAAVLIGMWYAGLTQSNGAAYLLCFVLSSVALISVIHTWANLRGLEVEARVPRPAFAGESLTAEVQVRSTNGRAHFGVRVIPALRGTGLTWSVVTAEEAAGGELRPVATARGRFSSLELRLESTYPLGFFTARSNVSLAAPHYIYPAPRGERPLPISLAPSRSGQGRRQAEGDDFSGLRNWRPGESQRHIDWKAVARGQPLLIKEWCGDAETTVILDADLLGDLDVEARLSQLAKWVVIAENSGRSYALRLHGEKLAAHRGEAHFHRCLRLLAEFSPGAIS